MIVAGEDRAGDGEDDGAGIGFEGIAEVEVPGEFAAEDALRIGEGFFHEDVADALALGAAAGVQDFFADHAAGAQVIDDCGAGLGFQEVFGQEGGQNIAADDAGLFIDEDAAVGVAVEADSEIGGVGKDGFLEFLEVGVDERVWFVFECAGDFEIDGDDFEVGLAHEDAGDELAGHADGAIDYDFQRSRCNFMNWRTWDL